MNQLELVPLTQREAKTFIDEIHRHNVAPRGDVIRVGLQDDVGQLRAVATAGRPIARRLQDGRTLEITRVATDGVENGCSMLYGALCRAAKALGWRKVITYTLESEPGTSLRAAGFVVEANVPAAETWARTDRPRDGERPTEAKLRWARVL